MPRYTVIERERRKNQALYFITRHSDGGVPMQTAPHEIQKDPSMRGVNPDTIQDYLYELISEGLIFVSDGLLKATPKVGERFKEWVKNGADGRDESG